MQKIIHCMEITPVKLAALTGGSIEGDPDVLLKGFATIEKAGKGDLSFIANPKYSHFIHSTKASAVLVSKDFNPDGEFSSTLIRVDDPYVALSRLMRLLEDSKPKPKGIEQPVYISQDAFIGEGGYLGAFSYIGKNVRIGNNVLIYPQVYIGDNVSIGDNTILYAGVKIYSGCRVGERCIIHSGAVIGSDGFGFAPSNGKYEKIPQIGSVEIQDNVEIGANTTIDRATFGATVIGRGTKLDNLIMVAHNVTIGENNVMAAQSGIAGSTHIGNGNRVGGQCGFSGHISIGDNNEFGAQSGIPKNVGDNQRLMGYPAVDVKQFARNLVYLKKLETLFREQNNRQ